MKQSRFTETQIVAIVREADTRVAITKANAGLFREVRWTQRLVFCCTEIVI